MVTFQPVPSSVNVGSSLSDPARRSSPGYSNKLGNQGVKDLMAIVVFAMLNVLLICK